jgi:eukaryotic-like serine/threonine-protein kinase
MATKRSTDYRSHRAGTLGSLIMGAGSSLRRAIDDLPIKPGEMVAASYRVERVIGIGGTAVVLEAAHASQRQRVAIKMLLPENASSKEAKKRFEREERMLAQLHSEHILRIYGTGQHRGLPFMLLELLEGTDLGELIRRDGPLPIDQAVAYVLQACHAVAEAHSLGITHRDIKPSNLFLCRRTDGSPCIKVLDFGVSKASRPQTVGESSILTHTSAVVGSPFYMSPEQMLGSRDVDARTDIWALGVTLFELVTRTLPFAAETPKEVSWRILNDEPTSLRRLRPLYPAALESVITRCLRRRPTERWANVADFARRLADFGPDHARHAVEQIYRLVPPTEEDPARESRRAATPGGGGGPGGDTTTMYMSPRPRRQRRQRLAIGLAVGAFAAGTGCGWLLGLIGPPASAPAPAAAATAAAPAARSQPLPAATVEDEDVIDLDEGAAEPTAAATTAPSASASARAAAGGRGGKAPKSTAPPVPSKVEF